MGALPTAKMNVNKDLGNIEPGYMKGDHTYLCNVSKEEWENNLLQRAVIAAVLSERNHNQQVCYIRFFRLGYTYPWFFLGVVKGKAKFYSCNLPFWEKTNLRLIHVKPYYDWYVNMPMEQRIEFGENCSVKLEKCGHKFKQISKSKVYETLDYGFRFTPDNVVTEHLLSTAKGFAKQLLSRHEALLLRYVAQIKKYIDSKSMRYRGFSEFDYDFSSLKILIDSTGVYVKCDETLPNECQFQQMGLPKLAIVQQFGMGLALRSLLERVTKESPTRMSDGTLIYHSIKSLDYDILTFHPNGDDTEKQYIGWVGHARSFPIKNKKSTIW